MKNAPLTAASRRFGRAAALNLILAAICHAQTPTAPVSPPAEQRIVQVRIVNESGTVLAENPPNLPVEKGANYSSDGVRETIRQLFRTGRYADLRAELTDVPGGVRLDFVVLENLFIGVVRVEGLREPPTPGRALAALQLGLGEGFRESNMKESLERLQGALRDDGFYLAKSNYKTVPHPETRQIDIVVTVEPGPRAKVGAVTIHGYTAEPVEKLRSKMRLKAGRGITAARLDRAAERLRKHIASKGRLGARATLRRGEYDAAANTVPLDVELTAGPKVRVDVTRAKISDKTLHTLLPMYQEGSVDEDLLQEGRRKIRDWLERDGFFDSQVQVASALDAKSGEQVITYAVERGSRRRLVGIDFSGNKYFSKETLRGRLNIQEASFLSRGRFRHSLLLADEEALREIYAANGFRQAEVNAELEQKTSGAVEAGDDLRVRFNIQEGVQTLVSELKVEGNRALEEETLRNVIGSSPGQPYSEFNVSSDRDNILALYFNEGRNSVERRTAPARRGSAGNAAKTVRSGDLQPRRHRAAKPHRHRRRQDHAGAGGRSQALHHRVWRRSGSAATGQLHGPDGARVSSQSARAIRNQPRECGRTG
ncbi:MAG: hypothetical protein HY046_08620, partial [Acidobacteria bacterium]|nr:hypothetical protein [Acidobacteriota bacterium]